MQIDNLQVHNYKSLRRISVQPGRLAVFLGPNASGKSNFADAVDFLSEAYRLGLRTAMARKGGYENMCFRRARRTRGDVSMGIRCSFEAAKLSPILPVTEPSTTAHMHHEFCLKADTRSFDAPYRVTRENLRIWVTFSAREQATGAVIVDIRRTISQKTAVYVSVDPIIQRSVDLAVLRDRDVLARVLQDVPPAELLLSMFDRLMPLGLTKLLGAGRVYQLSPGRFREASAPTLNPELDRQGLGLPGVVKYLQETQSEDFELILQDMRSVLPSLKRIDVQLAYQRLIGLNFHEQGFGRPWLADEVSDGTLRTLALLTALYDRRTDYIFVEEPENSLHPWAIRAFAKIARHKSSQRQIWLTTHSPVLVDEVKPEEIWVVSRRNGETRIDPLKTLDDRVLSAVAEGKADLADYIDAGAVAEAVPFHGQ